MGDDRRGCTIVTERKLQDGFFERIAAIDGMAVTSQVWNHAHDYHRRYLQMHSKYGHGAGILQGLTVTQDHPPGSVVRIDAGVAIDPNGRLILVPEARRCDLRQLQGVVCLLLLQDESGPSGRRYNGATALPIITEVFKIEPVRLDAVAKLSSTDYVELARVHRPTVGPPLTTAQNPAAPVSYELDLRHRRELVVADPMPCFIGLVSLGSGISLTHATGWFTLARELRQTMGRQVWIEPVVTLLDEDLSRFPLLCLVGRERFSLSVREKEQLYHYLRQGGVVFFEGCRYGRPIGAPPADEIFRQLLQEFHGNPVDLAPVPELLQACFTFAQPPDGYVLTETHKPQMAVVTGIGEGMVLSSTYDYGCLWAGSRANRPATRTELRDGIEWGANLISYAQQRAKAKRA